MISFLRDIISQKLPVPPSLKSFHSRKREGNNKQKWKNEFEKEQSTWKSVGWGRNGKGKCYNYTIISKNLKKKTKKRHKKKKQCVKVYLKFPEAGEDINKRLNMILSSLKETGKWDPTQDKGCSCGICLVKMCPRHCQARSTESLIRASVFQFPPKEVRRLDGQDRKFPGRNRWPFPLYEFPT